MDNTDQQNQNYPVSSNAGLTPPISSPVTTTQTTVTPISQTTVTSTSGVEDITPVETQVSVPEIPKVETTTETIVTPVTNIDQTVVSDASSQTFEAPPSASAAVITPMGVTGTTVTTTTTAPTELPTPSEFSPDQQATPTKKTISPAVMGLLGILFLGLASAGVFTVSKVISGQQAVAPTAPDSEPQASEPTITESGDELFNPNESVDCSGIPNTAPYGNQCRPTITDEAGNVTWATEYPTPEEAGPLPPDDAELLLP